MPQSPTIAAARNAITERFENQAFYLSSGGTPFYYEASTKTLNFGYGYNISANGSSVVLSTISAQTQVSSSLTTAITNALSAIANGSSASTINNDVALANSALPSNITDYKPIADSIVTQAYNNTFIPALEKSFSDYDNLSSGLQIALADLEYNTGGKFIGPKLTSAIGNNDIASAAFELAIDTYSPSQAAGYENRTIVDGMEALGFNVSITPTNLVGALAGSPANQNVADFLAMLAQTNSSSVGTIQSFLLSSAGSAMIKQLAEYTTGQGFYVAQASDTPQSVATMLGMNITDLLDLQAAENSVAVNSISNTNSNQTFYVGQVLLTPITGTPVISALDQSSLILPELPGGQTYVLDSATGNVYTTSSSFGAENSGHLFIVNSNIYNSTSIDVGIGAILSSSSRIYSIHSTNPSTGIAYDTTLTPNDAGQFTVTEQQSGSISNSVPINYEVGTSSSTITNSSGTIVENAVGTYLFEYVQSHQGSVESKDDLYQDDTGGITNDASSYDPNTNTKSSEIIQTDASNGSLLNDVHIDYGNGSASTTATVNLADGISQIFSLTGAATTQLGVDSSVTGGSGPSILVGAASATLTGSNGQTLFISLGNGTQIFGGTGASQVFMAGTNDQAYVSNASVMVASGMNDGVYGNNNSVGAGTNVNLGIIGNLDIVTGGGGGSAYVNGVDDNFTGAAWASATLVGTQTTITIAANGRVTDEGKDDVVNLGANVFGEYMGTGGNVNLSSGDTIDYEGGSGVSFGGTGGNIFASDEGQAPLSSRLSGSNITYQGQGSLRDTGQNNLMEVSDTTISIGPNVTAGENGDNNLMALGIDVIASMLGSGLNVTGAGGGTLSFLGTNDSAAISDATIYVDSGSQLLANGDGDSFITTGSDGSLTSSGDNESFQSGGWTFNITGYGNNGIFNGSNLFLGAGTQLGANGDGNTLSGGAGDEFYLTGTGNIGDSVHVSNDQFGTTVGTSGTSGVFMSNGVLANLYGSNNGYELANNDELGAQGTGLTINNDVAGDAVNLLDGSSATVSGPTQYGGQSGGIGIFGSVGLSTSFENIIFSSSGTNFLNLFGIGSVVSNNDAGDTTNLNSGNVTTVNGNNGAVNILGTVNLTANNQNVYYAPGQDALYLSGQGSTVNGFASGDALYVNPGTTATVTGNGAVIGVEGVVSLTVSNATITFQNQSSTLNVAGTGLTINADDAGNAVKINSGSATITGTGGALVLGTSTSANFNLAGGTINGAAPSTTSAVGTVATDAVGNLKMTFNANPSETIEGYADGTWSDVITDPNGPVTNSNLEHYITQTSINHAANGAVVEETSEITSGVARVPSYTETFYDPTNSYAWNVITKTFSGTAGNGTLTSVSVVNDDASTMVAQSIDATRTTISTNNGGATGSATYQVLGGGVIQVAGTSIGTLLQPNDLNADLPALNFSVNPSAGAFAAGSGNAVAEAVAGSYGLEYLPINSEISAVVNHLENINVESISVPPNPDNPVTDETIGLPEVVPSITFGEPVINPDTVGPTSFNTTSVGGVTSAGSSESQPQTGTSTSSIGATSATDPGSNTPNPTTSTTLVSGDNPITYSGQGTASVSMSQGDVHITLTGGGNTINGANGDVIITGAPGNSNTVTLGNGDDTVQIGGTGDTIQLGDGNNFVAAFQGMAFITTGSGNDTISVGGSGSTINAGGGNNSITGGSGNDTFILPAAGAGFDTISNFTETNSDVLDVSQALVGTSWDHSMATLGNYLQFTATGGNTLVSIAAAGSGTGTGIAMLNGVGNLGLSDMLSHSALRVS